MLAKIRKNITKKLKKKMKGFLMIQTALALITLGAMAVSFFQIYGGQFAAMAAARNGALAQHAADIVTEYYQMVDYDSLSASTIPKSGTLATLFGSGNLPSDLANLKFTCTLGAEKNFTTADGATAGSLRLATIKIMNPSETAPRATITVPLSSAGSGGGSYVKDNTKKTAGTASVSYGSDGYLHGYVNGTEKPFNSNSYTKAQSDSNYYKKSETYKKSELYTKAEVDSLIKSIKDTYLTSNYFVRNGNSSKPFTITYKDEDSSITMPEGKAFYANVLGINVPFGCSSSRHFKIINVGTFKAYDWLEYNNPFPGKEIEARLELFYNGNWIEPGFATTHNDCMGSWIRIKDDKIVIASYGVVKSYAYWSQCPTSKNDVTEATSLPARIKVWTVN